MYNKQILGKNLGTFKCTKKIFTNNYVVINLIYSATSTWNLNNSYLA